MWEIFRAELRYTRFAYFVFFASIPLLVLLNAMSEGGERAYVVWFIILMAVNYWNARRIREKRDFHLAQLPVTRKDVGAARALMVVILPAAYIMLYAIVGGALGKHGPNLNHLGFIYGLVVVMFSGLLIFRDRFVGTRSLIRGKILFVVIFGALFAAVIYVMVAADDGVQTGGQPPAAMRAIDAIARHNPLGNPLYMVCFVAASLLLAYVSVITFQRRRTNVE